jgi:hypothetical protein
MVAAVSNRAGCQDSTQVDFAMVAAVPNRHQAEIPGSGQRLEETTPVAKPAQDSVSRRS